MACREIAALRLGMMNLLGNVDPHEREHEELEIGEALHEAGPLRATAQAANLHELKLGYAASLNDLERSLVKSETGTKEHAYLLTLVALNRKIELEVAGQIESMARIAGDLDTIHDLIHVLHPN